MAVVVSSRLVHADALGEASGGRAPPRRDAGVQMSGTKNTHASRDLHMAIMKRNHRGFGFAGSGFMADVSGASTAKSSSRTTSCTWLTCLHGMSSWPVGHDHPPARLPAPMHAHEPTHEHTWMQFRPLGDLPPLMQAASRQIEACSLCSGCMRVQGSCGCNSGNATVRCVACNVQVQGSVHGLHMAIMHQAPLPASPTSGGGSSPAHPGSPGDLHVGEPPPLPSAWLSAEELQTPIRIREEGKLDAAFILVSGFNARFRFWFHGFGFKH